MNHSLFYFLRERTRWVYLACLTVALIGQIACRQVVQAPSSIVIDIYFDFSIEWADDNVRRQLIETITMALRHYTFIGKVRIIELGTSHKASETFSKDFDLGAPLRCPTPEIPSELKGNLLASQQAQTKADKQCEDLTAAHAQRIEPLLTTLQDILLRKTDKLTHCTSFVEFVKRLRQDTPDYALVVTDGRANCAETSLVYQGSVNHQLVVIQCPVANGRTEEYRQALQAMLPNSKIFSLPQSALAMKELEVRATSINLKSE